MKAPIVDILSPRTSPSLGLVVGYLNYTQEHNESRIEIGEFY